MPSRPKVVLRFEQGSVVLLVESQLRIVALGFLGSQPQIYQCDDFLTSDECAAILRLAKAGQPHQGHSQHWELTLAPFWILEASLPAKCFSKIRIDLDTNPQGNGLTLRAEGLYMHYMLFVCFCDILWTSEQLCYVLKYMVYRYISVWFIARSPEVTGK